VLKPTVRRKIPWDQWLDGTAWTARLGEDFDKIDCFRVMLYRKAKLIGRKVVIIWKPKEGVVQFQFARQK
jgi:hypothetical protein